MAFFVPGLELVKQLVTHWRVASSVDTSKPRVELKEMREVPNNIMHAMNYSAY
jgi:hypothetical protein